MITEAITKVAITVLDETQYFGAWLLMTLESMIAPIPSEAVMPFVGFQVADGKWNLWLAILVTSCGSITGSLLSYAMGYYGGKPLIMKVGKYFLLNEHDLEMTEAFFHKRQGSLTIFIARFVPVVRHLISIPAGIGKMPIWPFIWLTLLGATLWNSFLLFMGMALRENWAVIQKYSHQLDVLIVVGIVAFTVWFFWYRWRRTKYA